MIAFLPGFAGEKASGAAGKAASFTATVRDSFAGPMVEAAGELDYDTAPRLRIVLRRALAARPAPQVLVVDLAGVTFCDSAGLNTLLQARRNAERQDMVLRLARPSDIVTRLLEMTGVDQVFPVDSDVPDVVPHTRAG
ncbi:STAS domain-containing protein [Kitasatospora herbaricolor]|uniref:STAS domain-containing protein n=1 Tax=Kitasatospora herbaricolor TaxID=68217 RepID=UPI0036DF5B67